MSVTAPYSTPLLTRSGCRVANYNWLHY